MISNKFKRRVEKIYNGLYGMHIVKVPGEKHKFIKEKYKQSEFFFTRFVMDVANVKKNIHNVYRTYL